MVVRHKLKEHRERNEKTYTTRNASNFYCWENYSNWSRHPYTLGLHCSFTAWEIPCFLFCSVKRNTVSSISHPLWLRRCPLHTHDHCKYSFHLPKNEHFVVACCWHFELVMSIDLVKLFAGGRVVKRSKNYHLLCDVNVCMQLPTHKAACFKTLWHSCGEHCL